MIVVAIVAILASVVIPSWAKESRSGKAKSEVNAMFAELSTKEEQYFLDNDAYLPLAACPTAPNPAGIDVDSAGCLAGTSWGALRVVPPTKSVTCSYEVAAGPVTSPPIPPAPFTVPSPISSSWFYILATCDTDNDSTVNSTYFTSNLDQTIQKANEGN